MPTLKEVLEQFPDRSFLHYSKDRQLETAALLVELLLEVPVAQRGNLSYWGSPEIGEYVSGNVPEVDRLLAIRGAMKQCLTRYVASIGLAGFGDDCKDLGIGMNRKYTRITWGWPYRFISKARVNGSRVFLPIDSPEGSEWARDLPIDGIITDYI